MMYFHQEYCLFMWLPSLYPASFLYLRLTDIGHHLKISMSKNKFIFSHTSFPSWHLLCFCHFCYPFKCLGLPVSGPNFTLPLLPYSVTKTCQFSLYRVLEPFPLVSPTHCPCPGFKSITIPAPRPIGLSSVPFHKLPLDQGHTQHLPSVLNIGTSDKQLLKLWNRQSFSLRIILDLSQGTPVAPH